MKVCLHCEEEFQPKYGQSKYCSKDCSREGYATYRRNYKAERREILAETQRDYYNKIKDTEEFQERKKSWTKANKEYLRAYHLKRTYGITQEQYNELLQKQEHKCFICQKHEDEFLKPLAVDHNHKTGEIRGLLCTHCNHRVVGRLTDPQIAYRIYEYLSQGTGLIVPPKKKKKVKTRKSKT